MRKVNVAIVGCGFAGAAALRILARDPRITTIVFDTRKTASFLPLLPDVLGETVAAQHVGYDLAAFIAAQGATYRQETVQHIDISTKTLQTNHQTYTYDYLLLCTGSQTDFHGNTSCAATALKIDDIDDIRDIQKKLWDPAYEHIVINGGGYTGIETALNIQRFLHKHAIHKDILLVEYADTVVRPLPAWMRQRVLHVLEQRNICCLVTTAVTDYRDATVTLSNDQTIANALLIWTAGVRTAPCVQELALPQDGLGRLATNEYLQAAPHIYVAGDCAQVIRNKTPLRMAVRFAIDEGRCAARNILRAIAGKPLRRFKPFDPGYIVPLAHREACGIALGLPVRGRLAAFLHYVLCVLLSHGWRNRYGIVRNLLADYVSRRHVRY